MKNFDKVIKAIGVIAVIVVIYLYFNERSNKVRSRYEKMSTELYVIAEEIGKAAGSCYYSKGEDYDYLEYILSKTQYTLEDVQRRIESIADDLMPEDVEIEPPESF